MRIQECKNDNGQISSNAQHLGKKEEDKDQNLHLWVLCKSQQDEYCYCCVVSHYCLDVLGNRHVKSQKGSI